MLTASTTTFGALLRRLRKRAGMTQAELAAATGYSPSLIGALERNDRLPDVEVVVQFYLPALGLQDEPHLAAQLVELAARARGERPPSALTLVRERQPGVQQAAQEAAYCIPAPPTGILGRGEEIRDLCSRFIQRRGRLLTLVGPPGVGKTRLAQAVGLELQRFYRDGACFVPLAPVRDPTLVASSLLSALKVYGGSARTPQSRLIEHLRHKELLLVLDNFEQLLTGGGEAVELVAALLAECPELSLLVTSRERLHLRAEQRVQIVPLALPEAVELFVERCSAVDASFALTEAVRPTIEAICERLDRLPLALELSAAQMDLLSPSQLLAQLAKRRFELLADGAEDMPPRQRTLHGAIAYSYDTLDEEERRLFRSFGVFAGGCDLEAIAAVSNWERGGNDRPLWQTLHALVSKSLVRAEATPHGAGRYLLLESIREFAKEQARAEGEEDVLRERHYAAYLQLFRTGDGGLRGAQVAAWLARLEPEQDNLRAALQWAVEGARYADAAWLMLAAAWFWHHIGRWHESTRWHMQLLPHRGALSTDQRLAFLIDLAHTSRSPEAWQQAGTYIDEILGLLEIGSDQALHAWAWFEIAPRSAGLAAAGAALERSIACARVAREKMGLGPEYGILTDRDWVLSAALWSFADILIEYGEFERALPMLAESTAVFQARGNSVRTASNLGAAGRLALLQGELDKAHALLLQAVNLSRALNYHWVLTEYMYILGRVTLYRGDLAEAHRLLADSIQLCLDLGNNWYSGRVCTYLAELALWEGKLQTAEGWLAQSLVYRTDLRLSMIAQIERVQVGARLAAARGAYVRAATLFGKAHEMCAGFHYVLAGPARQLADAALDQVRAALDPPDFAEAFAAGQQMSLDKAVATILGPDPVAGVAVSLPHPFA